MTSSVASQVTSDKKRETFFKLVFGRASGFVCIAHRASDDPHNKALYEAFFEYPNEMEEILEHINRFYPTNDMYFCPQLLSDRRRIKDNVEACPSIWSDLDQCPPDRVLVKPSVILETSPGRYQAFWVLEKPADPFDAEDVARRIAYYHATDGADRSGWDLTQLLRIPLTYNRKYLDLGPPVVKVLEANQKKYRVEDFGEYPQVEGLEVSDEPMPEKLPEKSPEDILKEYKYDLNPRVWSLFYQEPDKDWSKFLWQLELILLEAGLPKEEVFVVAQAAACNKYERDNKPVEYLWKEILKAEAHLEHQSNVLVYAPKHDMWEPMLTEEEREWVEDNPSVIEEYIEWAKTLGDAAWQYHQAGAFIILSALLASDVQLPTSFGRLIPNLWVLILADTTLTRKTTAMDIAMDMILDIDPECVLATDGSIEGLLTSLSTRPGRASIFLRDEFSGLLEMISKKDYYAGMVETLTKLYDGKYQKRVLRKEIIEVRDPILILFAGGIKTRIMELLDYMHVSSGFIPRFVFVAAESDITRLQPLGPPTDRSVERRERLLGRFRHLYDYYTKAEVTLTVDGKTITRKKSWDAKLTKDAWVRYNRYEADMVARGLESDREDLLTPTMDRLAKSGLKMSVLLAAARCGEEEQNEVVVEEKDLIRTWFYIDQWAQFTLDLLTDIGKTASERLLERIFEAIKRSPGIGRSTLMQNHHLTARDADLIFRTLIERGRIKVEKGRGRGEYYVPVEGVS